MPDKAGVFVWDGGDITELQWKEAMRLLTNDEWRWLTEGIWEIDVTEHSEEER